MKKGAIIYLSLFLSVFYSSQMWGIKPDKLYKDSSQPTEIRVKDLLSQMTLEEKAGQLSCLLGWEMYQKEGNTVQPSEQFTNIVKERNIGMFWATLRADPWTKKTLENGLNPELAAKATNALQKYVIENTRLGIPIFFAEECPHGHMAIGTTVFPTSIGQSSTWNPELIQKMATTIALEARLQGGHIGYGPVLDLAREPRWSRVEETYGEDPVLNGKMGEAVVKGFQGNTLNSGTSVISTLKHFTAYGVPEGGHNGGSVSIGLRELHQNYLLPFEMAIKSGALSIMTAYNSIDGIPCSGNEVLLKDILRSDWEFNGFVVSDLGSIEGMRSSHRITDTNEGAAVLALQSGLDVDLGGNAYMKIVDAVKSGKLNISDVDSAVSHVLRLKFEMGLFENPYVDAKKAKQSVRNAEHIQLAGEVARQSIILLKNENNLLPLSKNIKNIAVIGPNADNIYNQLGDYTAPQEESNIITVLKGIEKKLGSQKAKVNYVKGCAIRDTNSLQIAEAVRAAQNADVAIVVLGGSSARDFKTKYIETGAATVSSSDAAISDMESGEGYDRCSLDLMGKQSELLQAIVQTGKPVILVTIQGRPLNINWATENVPAIINAWYPGQEGGNAIADVLFGDYNPAGRLPISIPRSVGQLPVYYNYNKPHKHDYVESTAKPLYSFGYGLSYSQFEYNNLKITTSGNSSFHIECIVKNTGSYDGDEVVQLYVQDEISTVVTPVIQLKNFKRIHLKKGAEQTVQFTLNQSDLKLLNKKMEWVVEPGKFNVMIGASSDDIRLKDSFTIFGSN